MFGSSLFNLTTKVFCSGVLFIVAFELTNPYVPRSEKEKAEEGRARVIYYKTRVSESFGVIISYLIGLATTACVYEACSNLAVLFRGSVLWEIIAAVLIVSVHFVVASILFFIVLIVRDCVTNCMKNYYKRRYNVDLFSTEEYDEEIEKST